MFEVFKSYLQSKINITDKEFEQAIPLLAHRKVRKGDTLLQAGDVSHYAMFVEKGCLRSYVLDDKGKEHITQFAPENWWIGDENSFNTQEPAMFYIDAIEDSGLVLLNGEFYEKVESIIPGIHNMTDILKQNKMKAMQRRIICMMSATAEERYLDFMSTYPNLSLRLPQHMIASYLGVTPESLSRIRKELTRQ